MHRKLILQASNRLGLLTSSVFQVIVKVFLDICKPFIPVESVSSGVGFANLMYDPNVCTGTDHTGIANDALRT